MSLKPHLSNWPCSTLVLSLMYKKGLDQLVVEGLHKLIYKIVRNISNFLLGCVKMFFSELLRKDIYVYVYGKRGGEGGAYTFRYEILIQRLALRFVSWILSDCFDSLESGKTCNKRDSVQK